MVVMLARALTMVSIPVALGAAPSTAAAGGLNDPSCHPAAVHPDPVVVVHGRGGTVEGFGALVDALTAAGHCVYGVDYGQVGGQGQHGVDHLWVSAAQIDDFIQQVLADTGADHVDVIGHSAGTGVLANFILARGGEAQVAHLVSIAGLQHPYAHAGAPGVVDGDLFLPNLIAAARLVDPDVTAQEVITSALALYTGVGGSLAGIDAETATSNFASDLFDPVYWAELHGKLSEPPGTTLKVVNAGHTLATADAAPTVCYTNLVGEADVLAGTSAGFQDPAPNVDNVVVVSASDHGQLLADPIVIARTLDALATPCPFTPAGDPGDPDEPDDDPAMDPEPGVPVGCAAGGSPGLLLGLAALGLRRRRAS